MTIYNNYYKAIITLRKHLDETHLTEHLLEYLKNKGEFDDDEKQA